MYYEAQPDWSDIDWIHGLHGLMSRDQAWKANLRNRQRAPISLELDIEEGWKRLVASRPLGPQILVYGDPLVVAGRHGGGFFCFLCFLQKRTGRHPAGRARVPTTQPSTPGSPHELGGWLDGPGGGRRRRIQYEVPINPLGALFNPPGIRHHFYANTASQ